MKRRMGLVDTSKVFGGGPSNFGFGYVIDALDPFIAPLADGPPGLAKHMSCVHCEPIG